MLRQYYELHHGGASLPDDLSDALVRRKQQIGQVEIIGAIAPYLSLPMDQLAGADIIHFIDNTSALAALTKGYSGVPDSARLVHTFHAWAAGAGVNPTTTLDGPTVGVASACTRISFLGFPFELRGPPFITRNSFSRRFRQAMRH